MLHMARETTDEQHTDSSFSIGTASKALRKKLNINWIQLNSESNDLACSSTCLSQLIPLQASRTTPTEAELCLLICSLFPVDFRLSIEDLVVYGMALKLFGGVHDIGEGRNKVYGLIKIINHQLPPRYLNKLCLWEDKYGSQFVKVFYCAKDLASSIASKYQLVLHCNEFVKRKWPNTNLYEYFFGLSLVPDRISDRRINLECLQLALLQLQHREDSRNSVVDIFDIMKESMILSLDVPSLPESLDVLRILTTLRLNILKLEDMSWIGYLMNLELLSISTPCLTDIPEEMGQLSNLRLLDLRKMSIAYIPPGVFSRMLKLEELYLPLSFHRWGLRAKELNFDEWGEDDYDEKERVGTSNDQMERINASISDITSVALHALEITIPDASVLPKNSSMFNNVRRFKIFVPNNLMYRPPGHFHSTNLLQLTGDAYDIKVSGICKLISRTEVLSLLKVRNLMNVTYQLHDYGCSKLQSMIVSECDELEYIVHATGKRTLPEDGSLFSNLETLHLSLLPNLKQIWHGRLASLRLFENLSYISIRFCNKLKYVFPLSIVRGSTRLKSIQVLDCIEMDGIFYQYKEDDKDLVCYSIEELQFHSLPRLVGFLVHLDGKISEVQDFTDRSRTTNEIVSTSMEGSCCMFDGNFKSFSTEEKASRVNERCIDDDVICRPPVSVRKRNSRENVSHQFDSSQLASFTMSKDTTFCKEKYVALISSKLAEKWMQDLKILEITFCDALQIIFSFEEDHVIAGAFNSLIELKLIGLRNLVHIWFDVPPKMISFQNLQLLVLSECHNMYLFSPHVAKLLVNLQKMYMNQCEKMEQVILTEYEEDSDEKIVFPRLRSLEFENIPNLKVFYCGIHPVELPLLESLKLDQCNKMEYFSCKSVRTPVLKRILINGGLCVLIGDLNTTLKRCMRNCAGTPAAADDTSSTVNTCALVDDFEELRNTPSSDDEFDGHEIDLPDSATTIDISGSEANDVADQSYLKEFTFDDLRIATNNFSSDALLGKGGFGDVYKGWLDGRTFSPSKTRSGLPVAIKKMKSNSKQGFREWQSEVYFLERLCHQNLIKLLGYCREDEEFLLVYEFIRRGSLGNNLFRRTTRRNLGIDSLPWELRLKIAIGAARGLIVLHYSEMEVIHRDFTSSNILLDRNYNAKISDFGLARPGPSGGDSHVSTRVVETCGYAASMYFAADGDSHVTTRLMGTYGYAAPEYVATGHLYVKSDVYSFGVVLLELLTGLRAFDMKRPSGQQNLVDWLMPLLLNKRKLKNVMDTRIKGQYSSKAMMLTAQLSLKCLEPEPKRRPSMKEVLEALEQIAAIKETPQGKQKFQFLKILKLSP